MTGEPDGTRQWAVISIHTALAGCDVDASVRVHMVQISIHTALAGCDNCQGCAHDTPGVISIHTALAGCDVEAAYKALHFDISIHTALAGCDFLS